MRDQSLYRRLPSVDSVLQHPGADTHIEEFGRAAVTQAVRDLLADIRAQSNDDPGALDISLDRLIESVGDRLDRKFRPSLRRVFNLTGTILHTNLGRAVLPDVAIEAVIAAAKDPTNLEYDLSNGRRGDRDDHVAEQLCRLTGAEAATVVNNNAAAVLLVLNSLALRKEVLTSRGELVEIGGSFRMPDIMARSGCRLVEVGTTNRTHLGDYAAALGPKTGLVMKVHASNYAIEGFTATVPEPELAKLCHHHGVPFAIDLGSGTLVDFRSYGLPHEPTPPESIAAGADVVTFSGDKLLGGPQAGIIVGRADIVAKIKKNPLKRALRVDKMTIAALSAVLNLYFDPDRLVERLPTLRSLNRPLAEIVALAERIQPALADRLAAFGSVEVITCDSQIGSGALPTRHLPSVGLSIRPAARRKGVGAVLNGLAAAFRALPIPVIGRIQDGRLLFDLRCLDDEAAFVAQLKHLAPETGFAAR